MAACKTSRVSVHTKEACWKVEGVSRLSDEEGKFVSSGPLLEYVVAGQKVSCEFRLYMGGTPEHSGSVVILTVLIVSNPNQEIRESLMWEMEDMSIGNQAWSGHPAHWKNCGSRKTICAERKSFIKTNSVNDSFTVKAKIAVWFSSFVPSGYLPTSGFDNAESVTTDLAALRASSEGCDVTLTAGLGGKEEEFRAHRAILAARSPVFLGMFFGPTAMKESHAGARVCLGEVEPTIADGFLQYVYTGKVGDDVRKNQDAVCHLLSLAHQYQVASLVKACMEEVVANLTEDNAAERLMLADLIDLKHMKEAILEFVCETPGKLAAFQGSDGYQRLGETRPRLLMDVVAKLVPPDRKKKRPSEHQELPGDLASKTLAALKQLCSDRALPTSGAKQVLVERLQQHAAGH